MNVGESAAYGDEKPEDRKKEEAALDRIEQEVKSLEEKAKEMAEVRKLEEATLDLAIQSVREINESQKEAGKVLDRIIQYDQKIRDVLEETARQLEHATIIAINLNLKKRYYLLRSAVDGVLNSCTEDYVRQAFSREHEEFNEASKQADISSDNYPTKQSLRDTWVHIAQASQLFVEGLLEENNPALLRSKKTALRREFRHFSDLLKEDLEIDLSIGRGLS